MPSEQGNSSFHVFGSLLSLSDANISLRDPQANVTSALIPASLGRSQFVFSRWNLDDDFASYIFNGAKNVFGVILRNSEIFFRRNEPRFVCDRKKNFGERIRRQNVSVFGFGSGPKKARLWRFATRHRFCTVQIENEHCWANQFWQRCRAEALSWQLNELGSYHSPDRTHASVLSWLFQQYVFDNND